MRSELGEGSIVRVTTMTPPPSDDNSTMDKWLWDPEPEPNAVNVSIPNIPFSLLKAFMNEVVWPKYSGGFAQAIKELMKRAAEEQREKNSTISNV